MDNLPPPGPAAEPAADAPQPVPTVDDDLRTLALRTLAGDVRDFLLDRQKHDHSALPWNLRGEDEQQRAIDQAEAAAQALVGRVFALVQSQGRPVVVGKLKEVKKKDGFEAKIAVDGLAPLRHALIDATGKEILIVLADSDAVMGDRGRPKPKDPRQSELFAGGADDEGGGNGPGDGGDDDGPVFDNTPSGRKH